MMVTRVRILSRPHEFLWGSFEGIFATVTAEIIRLSKIFRFMGGCFGIKLRTADRVFDHVYSPFSQRIE